ncbi:hypothetical protein ACM67C_06235 [Bergeriella denitrificans]|uniref:hypothetical protein n=1 Tax=Bergeriella denitrificans TaxID=494 RepID=UPI0011C025E2|nr:hypothetical protein [Bergeriella denitrificans]
MAAIIFLNENITAAVGRALLPDDSLIYLKISASQNICRAKVPDLLLGFSDGFLLMRYRRMPKKSKILIAVIIFLMKTLQYS